MKSLAAVFLVIALNAGSLTGASAAFRPTGAVEAYAAHSRHDAEPSHFDRCHGRTSGTAHHSCGTATGGPVGGLF